MKDNIKKVYLELQKRRKKIKKRSILLIIFLFGVNIYAWFVYMSNASLTVESSVSTWNVTFYDGNEDIKELNIKTDDLYPGMNMYNKKLIIKNDSDVEAEVSYEVDKINVLGNELELDDNISYLNNNLVFSTSFELGKTTLNKNDTTEFLINIEWPFEASEPYYKLDSIYKFNNSFKYYILENDSYMEDNSVTSSNYLEKIESGLYIESDDADTYFGEKCDEYKNLTGNGYCYSFHLKIKAEQKK